MRGHFSGGVKIGAMSRMVPKQLAAGSRIRLSGLNLAVPCDDQGLRGVREPRRLVGFLA
jgi:hypothetical protein